jgi:hypothetical protein
MNNLVTYTILHIRESDNAILQIETDYSEIAKRYWNAFGGHSESTYGQNFLYRQVQKYHEFNGKMYMYYSKFEHGWKVFDKKSNQLVGTYEIHEETIVHEHSTEKVALKDDGKYDYSQFYAYRLYDKNTKYDKAFWEQYDRPINTSFYKEVKEDLEKHEPLLNQFDEVGKKENALLDAKN